MNRFSKVFSMAVAMMAMSVFAEPYWALVTTDAYSKDTSPSASSTSRYTGYLCTVESAKEYFGGAYTIAGISTYLSENYSSALAALAEDADATGTDVYSLGAVEYTAGQYGLSHSPYFSSALSGEYLAVISYASGKDYAFRVFDNTAENGSVLFDKDLSYGGTAGAWTAAVPEPTSGLLILLGLAGLALKRRRA